MKPVLLVMNPRQIKRCVNPIAALKIDKIWLRNMYERELEPVIDDVVRHSDYTHFVLLSDDTIPYQGSLDFVLHHMATQPVVTGYCNLDQQSDLVNITSEPFAKLDDSDLDDYAWRTRVEVEMWPDALVPTFFAGSCLTGMSKEMWLRYPFNARVREDDKRGYASDWSLSTRLQIDKVPIVAPRGAYVEHVKELHGSKELPKDPELHLLVDRLPREVKWQRGGRSIGTEPKKVREMVEIGTENIFGGSLGRAVAALGP